MGGTFPHPQGRIWLPDHFVPLLGNYQISSRGKTLSPVTMDIPSPNFVQSPLKAMPSSECEVTSTMIVEHGCQNRLQQKDFILLCRPNV